MKSLNIFILSLSLLLISQTSFGSRCDGRTPDLSLALAIDVSGSVDFKELQLQMEGYQNAFSSQVIQEKFLEQNCGCTEISVILWSSDVELTYGPVVMDSSKKLSNLVDYFVRQALAAKASSKKQRTLGTTRIDHAISFTRDHLLNTPKKANKMSMIISGDGMITGSFSKQVIKGLRLERDLSAYQGIRISGVTIKSLDSVNDLSTHNQSVIEQSIRANNVDYKSLTDFYEKEVITPYSSVDEASSFLSFEAALEKNLTRETCSLLM